MPNFDFSIEVKIDWGNFLNIPDMLAQLPEATREAVREDVGTMLGPPLADIARSIYRERVKSPLTGRMEDSLNFRIPEEPAVIAVGYYGNAGGATDDIQDPSIYFKAVEKGWFQARTPPASRIAYYATRNSYADLTSAERRKFRAIAKAMTGQHYAGLRVLDSLFSDSRVSTIFLDAVKHAMDKALQKGMGGGT